MKHEGNLYKDRMVALSYKYLRLTHAEAPGLDITDVGIFLAGTSKVINKVD